MRPFIVANFKKAKAQQQIDELIAWVQQRAAVVAVEHNGGDRLDQIDADVVLVFGGDGTLLSAARRLGGRQIPLAGVNFGRLGFLSSFTPQQFREHFDALMGGTLPVSSRQSIEASLVETKSGGAIDFRDADAVAARRKWHSSALNEALVTAGSPFKMIELEIGADGDKGITYFGDGIIIATPSGSTAYNVAAGGPIITPDVQAICVTPVCPHSLAFRPIVVSSQSVIHVTARRVNPGTVLSCDGLGNVRVNTGDTVIVRRSPHDVLVIDNPDTRQWATLAEKLHWAISPNYQKP
jgi:NAD+ kinase